MYVYSCVLLLSNILSAPGNQLSIRELITFDFVNLRLYVTFKNFVSSQKSVIYM
jgi:hypothetical protein